MRRFYLYALLALLSPTVLVAEEPRGKPPAPERYEYRRNHDPNGIGKFYMGREIPQFMSHFGAGWLDRPEREKEEHPAKLYKQLDLKGGEVVADIGAGSGYHTLRLAERVGPKGKVYAVEIQREMLDIIEKKMKAKGLKNIDLVLGSERDPKLPPASVDVMLMVDVYHEIEDPYEMTEAMVKALKPGGRLVFVEFRLEDPRVPIKLVHKMSEKQVKKEMEPHPLEWVKTSEELPWQHIIIFKKKTTEKKSEKP